MKFLLVGDPVEHSRSPAIHREALRRAGLKGEYSVLRADEGVLSQVLERLRNGELDGVNVTMPLKEAAYRACERLTHGAERSASVNTLGFRGGAIEGHSSDHVAFATIYSEMPPEAPLHVLGAGGSARAALAAWPGDEVVVSARRPEEAVALGGDGVVAWGEAVAGAILVNATPIGMGGEDLPAGLVESASVLVDLPYGEVPTPAARLARALGVPVIDGIEFLARQGRESFRWWTGAHVDLQPLVEAAKKG